MTDLPKISVHIIAYNQKDYIGEAIDSALAQDYPNLEVVVADDASSDGTAEIIADYARNHPGRVIAVLNPKNLGITGNSNAGLRACSGEFIAFLGGDDILLPGKISAQAAWFSKDSNRVLCGHEVEVFYDDDSRPPHPLGAKMRSGRGASDFIRHGTFGALSTMVRASKIPEWGFDERLPSVSDQMLWIDILADGGEFGFVPGVFSRYRRHSANVTNDPIKLAPDYARQIELISIRHPQYAAECRHAYVHHVLYNLGVELMKVGRKREARGRFLKAIRLSPTFPRPWIRLAQSFF
jgi:glycosyltransferase involved in cell wall biosynthesis